MLPWIIGVGAAAAASLAGYHTMAPTSQLYGRAFHGLRRGSRRLALTYDDGPNDPWTLKLLDVLDRHGVKATFFLIGRFVAERPQIVREIAARGHEIGNHTWSHPNLVFSSRGELRRQLTDTREALFDAVGEHSNFFRPPFGGRRPAVMHTVRAMGLEPVLWRASGWDWSATSSDQIVKKLAKQIRGGEVILLHDGGHQAIGADRSHTVTATDEFLRGYKEHGYEFVTVGEMLLDRTV
jgi:peptidoglycan/xylan/chitin deacetylase (PgdA/CDA1 family)